MLSMYQKIIRVVGMSLIPARLKSNSRLRICRICVGCVSCPKITIASDDIHLFEFNLHERQRSLTKKTMSGLISAQLWLKGFAKAADEDRHVALSVMEVLLVCLKYRKAHPSNPVFQSLRSPYEK
jgi:hypothetical protein